MFYTIRAKPSRSAFLKSLRNELYGTHVHIQALCPGFVLTEFHDTPEYMQFSRKSVPNFLWMTPAQVVSESLNSLPRGKLICTPGVIYRFAAALARNSMSAGLIKFFAGLSSLDAKPL